MGAGIEAIADPGERAALRRQSRGVMLRAFALAAALTGIVALLP